MVRTTAMRHLTRLIVAVSAALALSASLAGAVTLVTPQGQPVAGQWQQWVNEMKVPTIAGTLVFVPTNDPCSGAPGCSTGWPGQIGAGAETWVAAGPLARYTLDFEMGHQFDWHYLTSTERAYLARKWLDSKYPWWDSTTQAADTETGLEADFAIIYSDCAIGTNDNNSSIGSFSPGVPQATPTINTCSYLTTLGEHQGASMERSAQRWLKPADSSRRRDKPG